MFTVRGECRATDGKIHTDSATKIITVLLYMNEKWDTDGGRLRILRNGADLDDYVEEVPPHGGTLLAFRRSENSWHGHQPFDGPRRAIQMNWVTDKSVVAREEGRFRKVVLAGADPSGAMAPWYPIRRVLAHVSEAYRTRRGDVDEAAKEVTAAIGSRLRGAGSPTRPGGSEDPPHVDG